MYKKFARTLYKPSRLPMQYTVKVAYRSSGGAQYTVAVTIGIAPVTKKQTLESATFVAHFVDYSVL